MMRRVCESRAACLLFLFCCGVWRCLDETWILGTPRLFSRLNATSFSTSRRGKVKSYEVGICWEEGMGNLCQMFCLLTSAQILSREMGKARFLICADLWFHCFYLVVCSSIPQFPIPRSLCYNAKGFDAKVAKTLCESLR